MRIRMNGLAALLIIFVLTASSLAISPLEIVQNAGKVNNTGVIDLSGTNPKAAADIWRLNGNLSKGSSFGIPQLGIHVDGLQTNIQGADDRSGVPLSLVNYSNIIPALTPSVSAA